ncbi:hypothetical protein [Bifidobacterium sp. SO4]|uniref:hypothetical protein n=1 Tax=Bifidobacterium sp. SO4 TaxID=2809030 RepID=UPI001BDC001E|nr:hypothetical protein [Bifidobacterium sp. SO4]MBT1171737.1 InlB B-repeat-containing protein [Bifidobacterium sp. SO4]
MTGNNKVWRAPLAGLASFAMIATMGVAAATANAATDAAKLTISFGDGVSYTYKEGELQSSADSKNVDGKIDAAELSKGLDKAFVKAGVNSSNGEYTPQGQTESYTVTGLSDNSGLEAVLTNHGTATGKGYGNYLVNPSGLAAGDVTLTARLQRDPYEVSFKTSGVTTGGVAGSDNQGSIYLAQTDDGTLDLVPMWAVPTTEQSRTDHKIAYKKDGKTMAAKAYWAVSGSTATLTDPTAASLYADAFAVQADDTVSHKAELTLNAAPATIFAFSTDNAVTGGTKFQYLVDNNNNKLGTAGGWQGEAATGETISDYLDFPTAVHTTVNGNQTSREWYAAQASTKDELDSTAKWTDSDKAGNDIVLWAANATNTREVTLHYNDASNTTKVVYAAKDYAPETPANVTTSSVEYKFAGWYTDSSFGTEFVSGALGNISDLYAKWDIAAVKFVVDPNYGTQTGKAVWVNNGANFKLPVASDYRSGWTATVSPKVVAAGLDTDSDGFADYVDNFNLYAEYLGSQKGHAIGTNVALKYQDQSGKYALKLDSDFSNLKPGQIFKFTNWSKATVNDLNSTLNTLKSDIVVKKGANYIKGADQDDFTAASFDQYVSDYQDFLKNNSAPKTVADYQSQIDQLAKIQAKLVEKSNGYVYRAYNKRNGDHYFTANKGTYDSLVKIGWNAEGSPYSALTDEGVTYKDGAYYRANGNRVLGQAIYSVYNRYTGEHLLTASKTEADNLPNGWENEGPAFFAPQGATEDVYRVYNPYTKGPAHVYTGLTEYNKITKAGWKGEDIVFKLNAGK